MTTRKVFLKTFLANYKNYIIFFLSAMVPVSLIFTLISVYEMISQFREGDVFNVARGAGRIVIDAVLIIGILTFFLMNFALKFYARTRIRDYSIYEILGATEKDLTRLKAFEYVGSNVCALIFGLAFGNLLSLLCKRILERFYFQAEIFSRPSISVYWYTTLAVGAMFGIYSIINLIVAEETEMTRRLTGANMREGKPHGRRRFWLSAFGILIMTVGVMAYKTPKNVESMNGILALIFGMALTGYYGLHLLLERRKKKGKKILEEQNFHFQYRSNLIHMFLLSVLLLFTSFYYPVQIISAIPAQVETAEYPYDFLWKMNRFEKEDEQILETLKTEYAADCTVIPMVTVTVPFGDNTSTGVKEVYNQGQNIGIPESAYEKLTGEQLHLKKKEICVFLQQGKEKPVHPLDYYWYGETYLHFGPANPEFFDYIKIPTMLFSDKYTVRETKRKNIIGTFCDGRCENIVVFSDEVFQELDQIKELGELLYYDVESNEADMKRESQYVPIASARAGLVNRLVLMHVPEENQDRLSEFFDEKYPQEEANMAYDGDVRRYYDSREARQNVYTLRIMKIVICTLLFGIFLFAMLFLIFLKTGTERETLQREYDFYHKFGMGQKELKRILFYRWKHMFLWSFVLSAAFGLFFTVLTLKMRQFTLEESAAFLKLYILLAAGLSGLYIGAYLISKTYMWIRLRKRMEG